MKWYLATQRSFSTYAILVAQMFWTIRSSCTEN
jgi:hypothetical protein